MIEAGGPSSLDSRGQGPAEAARTAHTPVLVRPVIELLGKAELGVLADCTIGLGGHAAAMLGEDEKLDIIGLDVDAFNLRVAEARLAAFGPRVRLLQASFADLPDALRRLGVTTVGGLLADLGLSSNQIADPARGFSFDVDGPLDMRLDKTQSTTAADLVNSLSEGALADLLYLQSQERHSRRIAKRICQVRRDGRLNSTVQLARIVASAVGENPGSHRARIHPATKTFMALRMAVNRELESLRKLLDVIPRVLRPGGRAVIISFHSGEDRLVKEDFRAKASAGLYRLLTKKPIVAEAGEVADNPRSRSARLRAVELLVGS